MPEVYSSAETSLELLDPITGAVIMTIPFLRDDTFSESPTYAPRGYHRSAAVSAARLRSKGTITIRKDVEGMAFAQEVERWQKGIVWYPMGSDLKGKRFRHPHVRKVMAQPDGTKEYRTGYDVRLSDRSLSRPDAGLVSESLTFDVQGGFDTPDGDRGEPVRALDFHRTGSATYIGTDGQIKTAGDGVARFGLPVAPVRRNLMPSSNDFTLWVNQLGTVNKYANHGTYTHPDGTVETTSRVTLSGSAILRRAVVVPSGSYVVSFIARKISGDRDTFSIDLGDGAGQSFTLTNTMQRHSATITRGASTHVDLYITSGSIEIEICDFQIEVGPLTPYQPTNATGVDLTHPLNGAGLALEGSGTNLCANNTFSNAASWSASQGAGIANITPVASLIAGKANALKCTVNGQFNTIQTALASTPTPGAVYTASFLVKTTVDMQLWFQNISLNAIIGPTINTKANQAQEVVVTFTAGSSGISYGLKTTQAFTGDIIIDGFQVEPGPFKTSLILTDGAAVTRQADVVGIVPPHNELLHSHDLTQAAWTKVAATVSKSGSSNTVTLSTVNDQVYQAVTPVSVASTTRTAAVKLKLGTLSGSVRVRLADQAGVVFASTTINTADLSATDARTFYVTGTPGASVTGLRVQIIGNVGTGTVIVESMRLVRGSHPGIEVQTGDTPIPAPVSPALDPAWQQNGRVRFRFLWAPGSIPSGKYFNLIGYEGQSTAAAVFRMFRSNASGVSDRAVFFDRLSNHTLTISAGVGRGLLGVTPAVNLFDGALHDVVLEWTNEIRESDGKREMWQRLYIDGILVAQQDVAALYGATAWAEIDPSRLISDGNVHAVLCGPVVSGSAPGGVIVEFAPRRAGYRQVDRAA